MRAIEATVTASFGRHYEVENNQGDILIATRRGKKQDITCNDRVLIETTLNNEAVIIDKIPCKNLFYRSDHNRQKTLAANIDQVVAVIANEPTFSDALLARILVAGESNQCDTVIVHNKIDLPLSDRDRQIINYYTTLNYQVIDISAKNQNINALLTVLDKKTSLLVGQSGMGKSTIINQLIPHQPARTNDISAALDSGKHTTTFTRRYKVNSDTFIIDSPGVQEFGLNHISNAGLENLFREFSPLIGQCRFHNCQHRNEPQCKFKECAANDPMKQRRLELLIELQQANQR